MHRSHPWRRLGTGHRRVLVVAAVLAVVSAALLAAGLLRSGSASTAVPPAPPPSTPAGPEAHSEHTGPDEPDAGSPAAVSPLDRSAPVRLSVPSLGISSSLVKLGRDDEGAMETPRNPDRAGWYTPGPTPGQQGPAVIAGHVTWNGEPVVFHRLGDLREGDRIQVERQDGRRVTFTVNRVAQYPKQDFPTVEVYGNLDHAGLRLITCGGAYSEADNSYADNVVVYASLTGTSS